MAATAGGCSLPMGEREWVILVQTCIEEEIEEEDRKTPVAIFSVPEALVSGKPEAYVPQIFAFGPYHHWLPKLYDMERHKIAAARRTMSRLVQQQGARIQDLVEQLIKREHKIRSYYQRNINHSMETIAWMMVVDASFLLEFLQNYTEKNREVIRKKLIASAKSRRRADHERMKMAYNMVLRDIVMLENQIPLYVLRKLTKFLGGPAAESADSELSEMLAGFAEEVSPFKTMAANQSVDDIVRHAHLLELLYYTIVPEQKEEAVEETIEDNIDVEEDDEEVEPKELELGDTSHVKSVYNWFKNLAPGLSGPLIGSLKRAMASGPVRLLVKLPWKVVTALPIFSIIKQPVESYFSNMIGREKTDHKDQSSHIDRPPLVEEIAVPSVADLVHAGVDFRPTTTGGITTVEFDAKTATVYLPAVTLDVNTEVVLRNLVAYEASAVSGPLVFTRYTELMNGIIDTEEDVRILRERGVVVNRMKSDGEAAQLWNGMSKSVRLTRVGFLDAVIRDVNKYYRSRWRVKSREFMKKYVFGSWQLLTFLAAALLLFLTCVQAFCSVYSCNSHITRITSVGVPPGTQTP